MNDVISRGLCVGCGVCAVVAPDSVAMVVDQRGMFCAQSRSGVISNSVGAVCPFADNSQNESDIAAGLWPQLAEDDIVGRYRGLYAGRVTNPSGGAEASSSGGMTTWLLSRLLEEGDVDAVISVGATGEPGNMYQYFVSRSVPEVLERRKSAYYSVTLEQVLQEVSAQTGERFAVVALPCFASAVRRLCAANPQFGERIVYVVGLVCGHMKSHHFAESLGWQAGVMPRDLAGLDFRVKMSGHAASDYAYAAKTTDGSVIVRPMADAIDGSWGYGAFQPAACDYCDDVFCETADVTFGDAWLPEYAQDSRGTNLVVTRDERLDLLLREAASAGTLTIEPLGLDRVKLAQGGGIRHRREGLEVRLADAVAAGLTVPQKRVAPSLAAVTDRRLKLIRLRQEMSRESFTWFGQAKDESDYALYSQPMTAVSRDYARQSQRFSHNLRRGTARLLSRVPMGRRLLETARRFLGREQ